MRGTRRLRRAQRPRPRSRRRASGGTTSSADGAGPGAPRSTAPTDRQGQSSPTASTRQPAAARTRPPGRRASTPVRRSTVSTSDRPGCSRWVRSTTLPSGAMTPRDAVGRGHDDVPAGLDGAQPGDRELLLDLVGEDEAGVAGLHGEQLGAVRRPGREAVVVGDVEADRVGDRHAGDEQRRGAGAAEHVAPDPGQLAAVGRARPSSRTRGTGCTRRRHGVALGVAVAGAGRRGPTRCPG